MVHCPRSQAHCFASTSAGAPASHTPLVHSPSPTHRVEGWRQRLKAVRAQQQQSVRQKTGAEPAQRRDSGLGDVLGPIGLTLGGQLKPEVRHLAVSLVFMLVLCRYICASPSIFHAHSWQGSLLVIVQRWPMQGLCSLVV